MTSDTIHQVMEQYIANGEMAGGALIVRKNDEIVFDGKWGWADISARKPVTDDTIFRMASMTKVVTVSWALMIPFPGIFLSLRTRGFATIRATNSNRE